MLDLGDFNKYLFSTVCQAVCSVIGTLKGMPQSLPIIGEI